MPNFFIALIFAEMLLLGSGDPAGSLARTRCFRLAPRTMSFEESYNEWGPPSFPVLDADKDSGNKSSSSTEDDDE